MSTHPAGLILASASPRRRELLKLLGLPFGLARADVDETPEIGEAPSAVVARLSRTKAQAASVALCATEAAIILACDTIVALEGEILGKPHDADEATAMLRRLRARDHVVMSALSLLDNSTRRLTTDMARTGLTMRAYTEDEIAIYVGSGDPLDKAGAYAIQNASFHPVADYRGCYANVVGLPLCHLARCLHAVGIAPRPGLPDRCQAHTGQRCTVFPDIIGRETTRDGDAASAEEG